MRRILMAATAFACLAASPCYAANAYISEYATLAATASGGSSAQIATLPPLATQKKDFSGGAVSATAFGNTTKYIRLHCDAACSFSVSGTATTSDPRIPLDGVEYFGVQPGQVLSVIANP
jgi:hypothetical protein